MTGPLVLCNSIGVSMGYPEPEIFRTASFFSLKGYRVILDDLRIRVYTMLKELLTEEMAEEAPGRDTSLKLGKRKELEGINGAVEDYLAAAARFLLSTLDSGLGAIIEEPGTGSITPRIDQGTLDKVLDLIQQETARFVEKTAELRPSLVCMFLMPRKVRETYKEYSSSLDAEFIFPFLLLKELEKRISFHSAIACDTAGIGNEETYRIIVGKLPELTVIYHNIQINLECLMKSRDHGEPPPRSLAGTVSFDRTSFQINKPRYDAIPDYVFADYTLADRRYATSPSHPFTVLVDGSTGCPLQCAFCNITYLLGPYRQRPGAEIARELLYYQDTVGAEMVIINDRIFNADIRRLDEFCEHLIAGGFRKQWCCYLAIRKEMSSALLAKMRQAGCINVAYGLESASGRVLKAMKKDYSPRLAGKLIEETHNADISVQLCVMTDFPGEEEKDFQKTLHFIRKHFHHIDHFRLNQFEPYAGSDVDMHPESYGLTRASLQQDFRESSRLRRMRDFILELEHC